MYMSELLLRSVELLTAITSVLTMKPGRTQNKRLAELKLKPSFIMSHSVTAPKSLVHFNYKKAASLYLGAQGTFNP